MCNDCKQTMIDEVANIMYRAADLIMAIKRDDKTYIQHDVNSIIASCKEIESKTEEGSPVDYASGVTKQMLGEDLPITAKMALDEARPNERIKLCSNKKCKYNINIPAFPDGYMVNAEYYGECIGNGACSIKSNF